jgi:RNA polymerase sigma-70 factor (ECF subfamily)
LTDTHWIYDRFAADVHRFATYLCGDPSLADDITSETFVSAWTAPGGIRQSTAKAYLFTIARNHYHRHLRRTGRYAQLVDEFKDQRRDVETALDAKDHVQRVLRALQALPEIDRAALVMRTQDEMAYAEIAETLGVSLAAVKVKIHRSRQKLYELTKT